MVVPSLSVVLSRRFASFPFPQLLLLLLCWGIVAVTVNAVPADRTIRLDLTQSLARNRAVTSSWHGSRMTRADRPRWLSDANGNPVLRVRFETAAGITNHETFLYEKDCRTPVSSSSSKGGATVVSRTEPSVTVPGSTDVVVDATFVLDELSGTDLWIPENEGDGGGAEFGVCLSLYLFGPGERATTRRNTVYRFRVNDDDAVPHVVGYYTSGGVGERRSSTERDNNGVNKNEDSGEDEEEVDDEVVVIDDLEMNFNVAVEGYVCDPKNDFAKVVNPDPFGNFDPLTVCVKEDGHSAGLISVERFQDLTLTQDLGGESNGASYKFKAIENGVLFEESMVQTDCKYEGVDRFCYAKMVLINEFFNEPEPNQIVVSGVVSLTFNPEERAVNQAYSFLHTVDVVNTECGETNFLTNVLETFSPLW